MPCCFVLSCLAVALLFGDMFYYKCVQHLQRLGETVSALKLHGSCLCAMHLIMVGCWCYSLSKLFGQCFGLAPGVTLSGLLPGYFRITYVLFSCWCAASLWFFACWVYVLLLLLFKFPSVRCLYVCAWPVLLCYVWCGYVWLLSLGLCGSTGGVGH